jgi:hypothetical protein
VDAVRFVPSKNGIISKSQGCAHRLADLLAGYDKQYEELKAYLERKMGDRIEVVAKKDKKITGNFEVSAFRTGDLLHSKKVAGQGRAESKEERRAILQQIEILLDEAEE